MGKIRTSTISYWRGIPKDFHSYGQLVLPNYPIYQPQGLIYYDFLRNLRLNNNRIPRPIPSPSAITSASSITSPRPRPTPITDPYNTQLQNINYVDSIGNNEWPKPEGPGIRFTEIVIKNDQSFYEGYPLSSESITFGIPNSNPQTPNPSNLFLPIVIVNRGQNIEFKLENATNEYIFNIHWHGMNNNAFQDGASMECFFGLETKIGTKLNLYFNFKNNSSFLLWHPHNMFETSPFAYLGMVGGILITDDESSEIDDNFYIYKNYLILFMADVEFDQNGLVDQTYLYNFNWRGNYTLINGISCVGWNSDTNKSYINKLYHNVTNDTIVKITLANTNCSWRQYNVGLCDKNNNIKNFYFVESDQGYRNPYYTNIIPISAFVRVSIIFDLNDFEGQEAYLFYYNYDPTENNNLVYNSDISKYLLNPLNTTPPTYQVYPYGIQPFPKNCQIIPFLKIKYTPSSIPQSKAYSNMRLNTIITNIKKLVFGDNYNYVNSLTVPIETLNYGIYLNANYFYNLPDFITDIPLRNLLLFYDYTTSYDNGATEYISMGANRIMTDMWNTTEYEQFISNPGNNEFLPTCLFSISKYSGDYLTYANYQMQDNHILNVSIYKNNVKLHTVEVIFPESDKPMNINKWKDLVNSMYSETTFRDENNNDVILSNILEYDWEPYSYKLENLENQGTNITPENMYYTSPTFIQTVRIKNINKSSVYDIDLSAPFTLLTFFGKPFTGMTMDNPHMSHTSNTHNPITHKKTHGMHGMSMDNLQQIFTYAGSRNGDAKPAHDNHFHLKIYSNETYLGFCDGYNNDNFRNIAVKKNSSEKWRYFNGDTNNFHPLHVHMTSGYVINEDQTPMVKAIINDPIFNYLYYSKDVLNIPPQFNLTFRLKFVNYSSEDGEIPYLGYMYHCHLMAHHDMNMMSQFLVYNDKKTYFN
jgi:hypothetical protein